MALSNALAKAGSAPTTLDTTAEVTFQPGTGITGIVLRVVGDVPGMGADDFAAAAEGAKEGCPVSQALKAVPKGYREASLALGATKLQTIMTNVLPYALPGILTSSVLSIARVAGETAPIMFTAAFVVRDELPWQVEKWTDFFFQGVMALPYHIYVVASKIPQNEYTHNVQYGTAFVFLFTVAAIAMTSIVLRVRLRKKYKW